MVFYFSKGNLTRHMKMHQRRRAEREYICDECGETFRNIFPFRARQRLQCDKKFDLKNLQCVKMF